MLLISITLTCLTITKMANYPVIKLVGVVLKFRKLNEKFAVVLSRSQQNLEFGHFTLMFCRGRQRKVTKFKHMCKTVVFAHLTIFHCCRCCCCLAPEIEGSYLINDQSSLFLSLFCLVFIHLLDYKNNLREYWLPRITDKLIMIGSQFIHMFTTSVGRHTL